MSSKITKTVTTRLPNDIEAAIREAAAADGITVSAWVSRRLRNNLSRTGRLAPAEQGQQQTTEAQ